MPFFSRLLRSGLALGLLAGLSAAPAAHAQDSTLTRLIRQNQYALQLAGNGQCSGAGWDKIRASVQQSQFVLVGESHGTAQIPAFTAALARVLQPALYVTEVDPYVAQAVTQLAAQPGPATTYLQRYPEALCFFDWAEEFELARTLLTQRARLVGLDQVYCTTSAPFYRQLAGLVKDPAARRYLQRRAAAYEAQNQAYEKTEAGDYAMLTQSRAAVDSLLLLTQHESPAARQMAQDYAASYAIYKAQAHQPRLNLMKRTLQQALQPYQAAGQPSPKTLLKFGANHLARGLSYSVKGEYYDVGNLVQNLADMQGQPSLHLYITGKQGQQAESDNPYFPAKRVSTYTTPENPALLPFAQQVTGPAWAVFDLRPLRRALTAGRLQVASQALQRILLGYDYLVMIPETTASHVM